MTALFPGSFDPFTLGHLNIAERASKLFDIVRIIVFDNPSKGSIFAPEERAGLIAGSTRHIINIETGTYTGLVSEYMKRFASDTIIRGVRSSEDFGIESERARVNRMLTGGTETFLIVSEPEYVHISSSAVREIMKSGVSDFSVLANMVPPNVLTAILTASAKSKE